MVLYTIFIFRANDFVNDASVEVKSLINYNKIYDRWHCKLPNKIVVAGGVLITHWHNTMTNKFCTCNMLYAYTTPHYLMLFIKHNVNCEQEKNNDIDVYKFCLLLSIKITSRSLNILVLSLNIITLNQLFQEDQYLWV